MFENLRAFVRRGGWEPQGPLPLPPLFDFLLFLLNFFRSQLPSGLPFLGLGLFCQSWGLAVVRQLGSRESTALGVGVPLPISPYEKLFVVLAIGHCSQYHPVTNVFSSGSSSHILLCPTFCDLATLAHSLLKTQCCILAQSQSNRLVASL